MNYYPFNIGDYAKHTKYLSMMQDLAYRRLIDLYYINEGPIAADIEAIAESIGFADHMQDVSKVLSKFFLISEGFYRNTRCDEVISEYHAKADRAKGANQARWKNNKSNSDVKSDTKSDVKSEQSHIPNNNQEPINNKKKEQKISSPSGSRLALDWSLPADWKTWAEQERPELDVLTQAASFADYWHGVAGAKGRKADWLATWRNWIRNSNAGSRPRAGPAFPPQKSKALQAIEKLQGIKNGLAQNGNQHRVIEADIARIGMGSGDGFDRGNFGGMDGGIDP